MVIVVTSYWAAVKAAVDVRILVAMAARDSFDASDHSAGMFPAAGGVLFALVPQLWARAHSETLVRVS